MRSARIALRCFAALAATLGAIGSASAQSLPPSYLGNFDAAKGWSFEPELTSPLPGDVFVPTKEAGGSGPEQDYTFLKGEDGNWRVDS